MPLPEEDNNIPLDEVRDQVNSAKTFPTYAQLYLVYIPAAAKALTFKEYSSAVFHSVFLIPDHFCYAALGVITGIIRYRAQVLSVQFGSTLAVQSPLSMAEAFIHFYPQIREIMLIILCFLLMLWLVLRLNPVLKFIFVVMMIGAPFYYIPELVGMAPGIDVPCGFFKMPLISFTVSLAVALSPIIVLLSLQVMYCFRRFIHPVGARVEQVNCKHPRGPTVKELNVVVDALSDGNMV